MQATTSGPYQRIESDSHYTCIPPFHFNFSNFMHRTTLFLSKHPPPEEDHASLSEPTFSVIRSYMACEGGITLRLCIGHTLPPPQKNPPYPRTTTGCAQKHHCMSISNISVAGKTVQKHAGLSGTKGQCKRHMTS